MSATLPEVLRAVEGRVSYLRAVVAPPDGERARPDGGGDADGWILCDRLDAALLSAAIDAGVVARGTPAATTPEDAAPQDPDGAPAARQISASLLAQSYAFKVGAVSLAAYAVGLPWPSPAAARTAVRLGKGRASGLAFRSRALGDPDDPAGLVRELLDEHLAPFAETLRATTRIGARLIWGNVAASCAAAFRAVEGAARDRGDTGERARIQQRAETWFAAADETLGAAGRFERVAVDGADGWFWTRTSCCLYFRVADAKTCDDCSLIPAAELHARRREELEGAGR